LVGDGHIKVEHIVEVWMGFAQLEKAGDMPKFFTWCNNWNIEYFSINSTHHATRRTASQGVSFAFMGGDKFFK
jgi:hypothetical protein